MLRARDWKDGGSTREMPETRAAGPQTSQKPPALALGPQRMCLVAAFAVSLLLASAAALSSRAERVQWSHDRVLREGRGVSPQTRGQVRQLQDAGEGSPGRPHDADSQLVGVVQSGRASWQGSHVPGKRGQAGDAPEDVSMSYGDEYLMQLQRDGVARVLNMQVSEARCKEAVGAYVKREMEALQDTEQAAGGTAEGEQGGGEDGEGSMAEDGGGDGERPRERPAWERQGLRKMLFFLHVPRTGGRTYHQCFLKALFPVDQRCPRSYDALRFNLKVPTCRLLATHNDYSLLMRLPAANVSVITNMRHPVDRIISSYEFALETASRSLRWRIELKPGETLMEGRKRTRPTMRSSARTETRNVWPWSILIPMLEDDLWSRRNTTELPAEPPGEESKGSYDRPFLMMPLRAFIEHPYAHNLLHNGATFHVAGITENSLLAEAPLLRACAMKLPHTAQPILRLAKARIDAMLHVGLTDVHKDSAKLFAAIIGRSLFSRAYTGPDLRLLALAQQHMPHSTRPGQEPMSEANFTATLAKIQRIHERSSVTLMAHYQRCVALQKRRYASRRNAGLRLLGKGVLFSREARATVDPAIVARIEALNGMDIELLRYAQERFEQERIALQDRLRAMQQEEEEHKAQEAEARAKTAARDGVGAEGEGLDGTGAGSAGGEWISGGSGRPGGRRRRLLVERGLMDPRGDKHLRWPRAAELAQRRGTPLQLPKGCGDKHSNQEHTHQQYSNSSNMCCLDPL